jgi:hypothetical protein
MIVAKAISAVLPKQVLCVECTAQDSTYSAQYFVDKQLKLLQKAVRYRRALQHSRAVSMYGLSTHFVVDLARA